MSLMWYLCPGGQTESNYTRTVWLMCLSCDSGAMPRIWVLEVSLSTCTELQHCCLQWFFFCWAMVQTLPWLLISVRILLCPLAVLHPMLFFAALGALSSSPAPMPWSAPLLHCRKKKKQIKATRKNKKGKKQTWEESSLQVLCLSQDG